MFQTHNRICHTSRCDERCCAWETPNIPVRSINRHIWGRSTARNTIRKYGSWAQWRWGSYWTIEIWNSPSLFDYCASAFNVQWMISGAFYRSQFGACPHRARASYRATMWISAKWGQWPTVSHSRPRRLMNSTRAWNTSAACPSASHL